MTIGNLILKYALQNAIRYKGKANSNAIIGKILREKPELKSKIAELSKQIQVVVNGVNMLNIEEQESKLKSMAPDMLERKAGEKTGTLPDLPNIQDKVVLRMAPYPSGSLHIGNAYPYIINDYYAKKYCGKLLLILDDTIGSKEKDIAKDSYKLIPDGLKWLDIKFSKIYTRSSRMNIYYKYAEELIKKNMAYVCFCNQNTLRNNRLKGISCQHRDSSIKDNLANWKKMFKMKDGQAILRIKTDMNDRNPAFRDRVIFRIVTRPHPKTGKKFRVWPMLEMTAAVDDYLLGITHIIRGKELMIESDMEKLIWDVFNWRHSEIIHTGLIKLEGVKISKSKSKQEVLSGRYFGWDDPRTWSLQSLKRRGIKPKAIRNFCLNFGLTNKEITAPIDILYTENRKLIEKDSNRYFILFNPRKIKIKDASNLKAKLPLHPDYPDKGSRILETNDEFYIQDKLDKNKIYRFMHLFNFKDNKFLSLDYNPDLNSKQIHWLPGKGNVNVEILMPDGKILKGLGEKTLLKVKIDEMIQAERFAYLRLDKKTKNKLTFWYCHK